jgi:hypothetical protein
MTMEVAFEVCGLEVPLSTEHNVIKAVVFFYATTFNLRTRPAVACEMPNLRLSCFRSRNSSPCNRKNDTIPNLVRPFKVGMEFN